MVIGLEVHVQLQTDSKIFSESPTNYCKIPNSQISWVDLAMPGTLPVLNRKVVDMAVIFGLAIDSQISKNSYFSRKNYFYPDLSKGYQISQADNPIVQNGKLNIETSCQKKTIRIERAHLEEDAGKSVHHIDGNKTGINYNRAGIGLLEIVTKPDFRSSEEVLVFLKTLRRLVRHLGICDGNMQEGSFRADVNLSSRKIGDLNMGTRSELKNINSFKFIKLAINREFQRQIYLLEKGQKVIQETRLYDPEKDETRVMRSKENVLDYRYFPDPDLPAISLTDEYIQELKKTMPILPHSRLKKYTSFLSEEKAEYLMDNPGIASYFDKLSQKVDANLAFNWISIELNSLFKANHTSFDSNAIPISILEGIIKYTFDEEISMQSARKVLQVYYKEPNNIDHIIDRLSLRQTYDLKLLEGVVESVFSKYSSQVAELKSGKSKLMGFFMGQIMKQTKGRANARRVTDIIKKKLVS